MESYSFEHVSFTYPQGERKAPHDISFRVRQGEFLILCGPSGCGKSTLLRHLKSCLMPHGHFSGEIRYRGMPLAELPHRQQAQEIGFVLQSPENQVVTDKVWHELAFGLESLGYDTPTIRRRVAEIAAFFGIENWFYKDVTELSGGRKQLLSLASVMAMQPGVLVLDEPTAQLDPIAAADFLALLGKINREPGTTIILTEHRLEEAFPFATRVIVMNEGAILCDDKPENAGLQLRGKGSGMFLAMPTAMRVWAAVETGLDCPMTVRDGSHFLSLRAGERPLLPLTENTPRTYPDGETLRCENLWFRYEKDSGDVVKGFTLSLRKGEFYALLGGNGAGKSTTLKVISGLRSACRGEVHVQGKLGHLPQNPQTLFVKRTVREELYEVFRGEGIPKEKQEAEVARITELCGLRDCLDRHPYDISGGEQLLYHPRQPHGSASELALVIIAGVSLGGETGFLVGAVTMLASNVLFSQGPWTPWQMFAMGIIGFLVGILFRKGLLRRSRGSLAAFGAFAAVVIYGGIMNPASALMYSAQSLNVEILLAYYVSGLPMDLIHAAATVIFLLLAAEPMLEKLDRIKVKYGLEE